MRDKRLLVTICIVAMWIAVGVAGASGGEFETVSAGGDATEIPAVWGVALFAAIATVAVAYFGFRD